VKQVDIIEEVAAIEAALRTLLSAIDEQNVKRRASDEKVAFAPEAARRAVGFLSPSENISPVEELWKDPFGQSYRLGIRRLGKRLHELGGPQLMSEAIDRVCMNRPGWARTVDSWWHGIGDWAA